MYRGVGDSAHPCRKIIPSAAPGDFLRRPVHCACKYIVGIAGILRVSLISQAQFQTGCRTHKNGVHWELCAIARLLTRIHAQERGAYDTSGDAEEWSKDHDAEEWSKDHSEWRERAIADFLCASFFLGQKTEEVTRSEGMSQAKLRSCTLNNRFGSVQTRSTVRPLSWQRARN